MLKIINLTKTYEKTIKAVDGLSLAVKAGEIYGFIGHNGAGKSTTIKSIVGALGFEDGDILIDGVSIKDISRENLRNILKLSVIYGMIS